MKILNNVGTNSYKTKFLKSLDNVHKETLQRKSAYYIDTLYNITLSKYVRTSNRIIRNIYFRIRRSISQR